MKKGRALIVIVVDHAAREGFAWQGGNLVRKLSERIEPGPDLEGRALRRRRCRHHRPCHSLFEQTGSERWEGDAADFGFAGKLALDLGRDFERERHGIRFPDQV